MLFQPAARYPADPRALFILVLSALAGVLTLALESEPGSLETVLPRWAVLVWVVTLLAGSVLTLGGMAKQTLNGVIVEQVGSVAVGASCTFYGIVGLLVIGPESLISTGIIFAWGLACFARWLQLQVLINSSHRRHQKTAVLEALYADIEAHAKHEIFRRDKAHRNGYRP